MLIERSTTLAPDTEQAEQPPQDYAAKGEQALGYDSDYASTYDYPTNEDTDGTLSMEAVCVIPSFAWIPLCPELVLIYSVLQQSDSNYYNQNSMEYQSHHGYEQEVMDAAYYNQPPVFLRQPVSHLV